MKYKHAALILFCAALPILATTAQESRASDNLKLQTYDIASLLNEGNHGQMIVIQGRLTNFLGDDLYEFTDTKSQCIEVDLDDDYNWSCIRKDELIELKACIEKISTKVRLDAKSARALGN